MNMIPEDCLPQFDNLFVISDLHLGGLPNFQIFNAGVQFQRFLDHLRKMPSERKIGLLINGDLVDFLAESPARAFDPEGAVAKLVRISTEPAFVPVWQSLQKFVSTKNRRLLINMGNHDTELALPWVRAKLMDILAGDNNSARGRISLIFDGTGVRCRVGQAEVLALHGNEVDDWNVTDFEKLRRIGRDYMLNRRVEEWIPNAGSQLVVTVMNSLKRKFPFIDLLKPEGLAVVPTLLALAPDQRDKLMAITAVAGQLTIDRFRRSVGLLGQAVEPPVPGLFKVPDRWLNSSADSLTGQTGLGLNHPAFKANLLRETEAKFKAGVDPMMLVHNDQQGEYLGLISAMGKFFSGSSTTEILREVLEDLSNDQSFEHTTEDETFRLLDEQIGDGPTFIVAGHTHLERALPRQQGRGWYFNSGTWVRLIRISPALLENEDLFQSAFNAFKAGTMAALDNTPNLILQRLTVVAFWTDSINTFGELQHVNQGNHDEVLKSVPMTRFSQF